MGLAVRRLDIKNINKNKRKIKKLKNSNTISKTVIYKLLFFYIIFCFSIFPTYNFTDTFFLISHQLSNVQMATSSRVRPFVLDRFIRILWNN